MHPCLWPHLGGRANGTRCGRGDVSCSAAARRGPLDLPHAVRAQIRRATSASCPAVARQLQDMKRHCCARCAQQAEPPPVVLPQRAACGCACGDAETGHAADACGGGRVFAAPGLWHGAVSGSCVGRGGGVHAVAAPGLWHGAVSGGCVGRGGGRAACGTGYAGCEGDLCRRVELCPGTGATTRRATTKGSHLALLSDATGLMRQALAAPEGK